MKPELKIFVCVTCILIMFYVTSSEIFTSSLKLERMVTEEEHLLRDLRNYIEGQYDILKNMTNFYIDRLIEIRLRGKPDLRESLKHPNAMYHVIKSFFFDYGKALGKNFDLFQSVLNGTYLTGRADIRGSRMALLRLQKVYNLTTSDMINGNYLGYLGPTLQPMDAFLIGVAALSEEKYNQSLEWLNASLQIYSDTYPDHWNQSMAKPSSAIVKRKMDDVYHLINNPDDDKRLYDTNLGNSETETLRIEVKEYQERMQTDSIQNLSRLCSLDNKIHLGEPTNPRLVCRYREALLPYYRFKEELLSISPFVSVFYEFLRDDDSEFMKTFVQNKLKRGRVVGESENASKQPFRTNDVAWLEDYESELAWTLSLKIKLVTGLETSQNVSDGFIVSEPFQVVNYGLGGHYDVHMDTFKDKVKRWNRIATFLLYLSDVERGGSTVFTRLDLSVAPKKNMALFWYGYNPAMEVDYMTRHAGCPVLYGHKWIANKWIWMNGNTFRRRCGLTHDATQLDIEDDMRRGYK